ncbi:MAG: UDP-N-acetylmuramate--L-alanine ligase [Coriobacteriales bacterium]|nr:UDP-N-acetylmuramate--L-alanine ligase [Coriobacteriales bacterium]
MDIKANKIHFIGIGGVGMSAIASIAASSGYKVSGSDIKSSSLTDKLADQGLKIFIGHDANNIAKDVDAVVVSTAIRKDNPEFAYAQKNNINILHRSEMLALLGVGKKTLACTGTHGKTTTSSMLATIIDGIGADPTFLIGGTVGAYKTNAQFGRGEYYIVEADESDASFLNLDPYAALITNLDADHLDHYKNLDNLKSTFKEFIDKVPNDGLVVVCADDQNLYDIAKDSNKKFLFYGGPDCKHDCNANYKILKKDGFGYEFEISFDNNKTVVVSLKKSPGVHNVLNACGVLTLCYGLGIDVDLAAKYLSTFEGVKRRFEFKGTACGVSVFDDYAHHPTEIKATIKAVKNLDFNNVYVVFQPHRYSRTRDNLDDYKDAFADADFLCLLDVYAAGEAPIPGINGKIVLDTILDYSPHSLCAWMPNRMKVAPYIASKVKEGDIVLTMGAGDVTSYGPQILDYINKSA